MVADCCVQQDKATPLLWFYKVNVNELTCVYSIKNYGGLAYFSHFLTKLNITERINCINKAIFNVD